MTDLRRHTLVWLTQSPQPELERDIFEIHRWQQQGKPFVVCRQKGGPEHLSLGFCLMPEKDRADKPRRFAVQALREQVVRMEDPPSLLEVARCDAGAAQRGILTELSHAALSAELDVRVFGSRMWQTLTGDPYVKDSSDLDLLITVGTEAEANRAVLFLQYVSLESPFPIDGELSFPGRGEVHWREYLGGAPVLLFKSLSSVQMTGREELWR